MCVYASIPQNRPQPCLGVILSQETWRTSLSPSSKLAMLPKIAERRNHHDHPHGSFSLKSLTSSHVFSRLLRQLPSQSKSPRVWGVSVEIPWKYHEIPIPLGFNAAHLYSQRLGRSQSPPFFRLNRSKESRQNSSGWRSTAAACSRSSGSTEPGRGRSALMGYAPQQNGHGMGENDGFTDLNHQIWFLTFKWLLMLMGKIMINHQISCDLFANKPTQLFPLLFSSH